MALSYTKYNRNKLEQILEFLQYKVRYDSGNFKMRACILENSKIIAINKFSSTEIRITAIVDLLKTVGMQNHLLTDKQNQLLQLFKQTQLQF
jgi:citrate lyase synthetase